MRLPAIVALLFASSAALADEPHGCDKFAWSIAKAQQLLASPTPLASVPADRNAGLAVSLPLKPLTDAGLKFPPERKPKDTESFAGSIEFAGAKQAASYAITLSAGAWIDVVQGGQYLKPVAFTGALDCAGVRKSVKFAIGPDPFTLQLSGVPSSSINVVVTPAE
jgi:hypothetical protein